MALTQPLSDALLDDLAVLVENFEAASEVADFRGFAGIGLPGLRNTLASTLGIDDTRVQEILRAITGLKSLFESWGSSTEAVEWITANIADRTPVEWQAKYQDRWLEIAPSLPGLLDSVGKDHPIVVAMKAQSLAMLHQNLLLGARIIADLRPVFNEDGTHVDELIVSHSLIVEYSDGTGQNNRLALAMDYDDLVRLQTQCERAATKILTLANEIKNPPLVLPEHREHTK